VEVRGPRLLKFLAYFVVLCGDPNQILLLASSQNIWPLPKFCAGFANVVYMVCGSDGFSRLVMESQDHFCGSDEVSTPFLRVSVSTVSGLVLVSKATDLKT